MRRGFTLFEMLIVLAIIVVVSALAVPVMHTMLDDAHMTAGADMMRARLADTRANAFETGKPWKLAYLPYSGIFQLAAEDDDEWSGSDHEPKETPEVIRGELPKDILLAVNRDDIAAAQGSPQAAGGWQTLAIFNGAGSARDDGAVYIGKAGYMPLRLRVRGLTGAVTIDVPALVRDDNGSPTP
jgi:prepilin-type N-terminal cleavage/methylation domain-containing protein